MTVMSEYIEQSAPSLRVWPTFCISVLAVFLISLPNLLDPMIRWDDFPALLAEPSYYWDKTLHEGRWVNYFWHLRVLVTPAWLNFAVYQILWAAFASTLAVAVTARHGSPWFTAVLALLIIVAPPATLISLWFNTLIPGLALVALYAWLGCKLAIRTHRAILPLFVVLGFMAYTMYPLLMLAICLVRTEDRSIRDLFGLLTLFVLSFALAVLTVYTINYQVHGVFGVPLADWRDATPAHDLTSFFANAPLFWSSLLDVLVRSSFGMFEIIIFHLAMLIITTLVLLYHAPREALYLHAGLWLGMGLVVVQILKLGTILPPRGFLFVWVFYVIILVRAALVLRLFDGLASRIAKSVLIVLISCFALNTLLQYSVFRDWQKQTQQIAKIIGTQPVNLQDDVSILAAARKAQIQNNFALVLRMQQLSAGNIVLCSEKEANCLQSVNTLKIGLIDGVEKIWLIPSNR